MPHLYFASPLFTEMERTFNAKWSLIYALKSLT